MIDAFISTLSRIADLGGPVVLVLIGLSIAALSVMLYKAWQFVVSGVGRHRALVEAVAAWEAGDLPRARDTLGRSRSYLRPVIDMAMSGRSDPEKLTSEAEARFARLERGGRFLEAVSQLSPLLGLFGTVLGMISAFKALQGAGSQVDPSILAGGIWVALLTTAVGLAVAMPTALVHSWFEARMEAERVVANRAIRAVLAPLNREETSEHAKTGRPA
ncbi:MotA/TolQ/ExbB proton channel family protein [Amaricoccus macauensis]|uniref:MotA/TolQ/ExbB proton channel family protein n=1 Tax=Amaricoccus macauensis TaxID=57001 RepID=UPI003C7DACD4